MSCFNEGDVLAEEKREQTWQRQSLLHRGKIFAVSWHPKAKTELLNLIRDLYGPEPTDNKDFIHAQKILTPKPKLEGSTT